MLISKKYPQARPFFYGLLFLTLSWAVLQLIYPRPQLFLLCNSLHSTATDIFFRYATWLGDGTLAASLMLLALLFLNMRKGLAALLALLLLALLVNLSKHVFFPGLDRPVGFLGDGHGLHLVDGVNVHHRRTFPSGHTAAAFSLFFSISLLTPRHMRWAGWLSFLLALIVGASRVYLSQHFPADVIAGAWLGSLCSLFLFWAVGTRPFAGKLPARPLIGPKSRSG